MRRLNQRRELLLAFKKLRRSAGDLSVDRGRFEDVMLCLFRHRIRNIQATATGTATATATARPRHGHRHRHRPPSIGRRSRALCVARRTVLQHRGCKRNAACIPRQVGRRQARLVG